MATCPKCGTRYASTIRICAHDGTVLNDEPVNDPHVGKLLDGKYRLDTYLSQGGMGAVYKATHVMLDKTVAVKLIKPELVTSAEIVRRFQREARAASNLNHPNIVSVYDLGQTEDGTLYIAMEFIDGQSLKDVIRKTGPLPVARIKAILAQVASALGEAHSHNIIHRDLKPHNVMLAKGPGGVEIAKLLDFGIAKTFEEGSTQLTQTGFAIGTPQYMAPEQAAGKDVTPQSDLYSLGVILYEMLTGEVPFDAPTTAAILIKQLTEAPQPPSRRNPNVGVSEVLEAITLRCLDKEPTQRFSDADAFAQALKNADSDATRRRASEAQTHGAPIPSRSATTVGGAVVSAPVKGLTLPPTNVAPVPAASVPAPAPTATSAPPPIPTVLASPTPAPIVTPTAPAPVAAPPLAVSAAPPSDGTRPTVPGSAMRAATVPPAPGASSKTGLWITLAAVAVLVMAVAAVQLGVIPNGQGSNDPTEPASAPLASPASADAPSTAAKSTAPPAAQQAEAPPPSTPASGSSLAAAPAAAATPGAAGRPAATATPSAALVPAVSPASASAAPAAAPKAPAAPSAASAPAAAARPGAAPAAAGRSAASPASAPAPAQAAAARPEHPSVFFRCAGEQPVCASLRSTMLASLDKSNMPLARDAERANVLLSASVEVLQDRVSRDFGKTFATRTYSVEVNAETKEGQAISMPAPKQFSFDAQFGRERLEENARVIASDVVDKVRAYWNK